MSAQNQEHKAYKRKLDGVVVSAKPNKTAIVSVARKMKDATYSKFINKTKKFHVHDEKNAAKEGDKVTIIESRPYSKLKKWELFEIHAAK